MVRSYQPFMLIPLLLLGYLSLTAQPCENRVLYFDGTSDYLTASFAPITGNSDFSAEAWIFAEQGVSANECTQPANCIGSFRRLFSIPGTTSRLELGECNGFLYVFWYTITGSFVGPLPVGNTGNICVRDGNWHHIALTYENNEIKVFYDCVNEFTMPVTGTFDIQGFRVGHWSGTILGQDWQGMIDEVRVWSVARTLAEIDGAKHCLLSGSEANLELYWQMDQGDPGNNNTSELVVNDLTANANHGIFSGFALNGPVSNFVCSGSGLVYPNLQNLEVEVRDYPLAGSLLSEICTGDPVIFNLLKDGTAPPAGSAGIPVSWEYNDGGGWLPAANPPFIGYSFPVGPGEITTACTGADGFVDRKYRAITTVTDPALGETCEYISEEYDLRICCPIGPGGVLLNPNQNLCEGETVTFNVGLVSADQYIINPGPYVDIEWYFFDGTTYTFLNYTDQTTFTETITAPFVTAPTDICFEARISNCGGKTAVWQNCVTVDPEPVCGTIIGQSANLTLESTTPWLTYSICPDDDAVIGIDVPFEDCIPVWQYSFDNVNWFDEGSVSNPSLNTNSIPWDFNWMTGATSVFYRIKCNPLTDPSGCDPCFSDPLEIQIEPPLTLGTISGPTLVCENALPATLSYAPYDPTLTTTWYCNGLPCGTGPTATYGDDRDGCVQVEVSNGCETQTTPLFCMDLCKVTAVLSCPLPPNDCACLGDPITISACDSESSCSSSSLLTYLWFVDGIQQTSTACTFTHTPAASGTTYQVIVLDPNGCQDMTAITIVPCDKP